MPCGRGVKAGMVRVWVAGETVWSPRYTRPISDALAVVPPIIRRDTNNQITITGTIKSLTTWQPIHDNRSRSKGQRLKSQRDLTCNANTTPKYLSRELGLCYLSNALRGRYVVVAACVAKPKFSKRAKTQHFRAKSTENPADANDTPQCDNGSRS